VNEKYMKLLFNQMKKKLEKIHAKTSNMMLNVVMGLILNTKGEYNFDPCYYLVKVLTHIKSYKSPIFNNTPKVWQ
jgi:hypothetical protein